MTSLSLTTTYVGGPTAILDVAGLRFITDPRFDNGGTDYETRAYVLHKTASPAADENVLGNIDAVLLSHDHHFDNLDRSGRALLARAQRSSHCTTRDRATSPRDAPRSSGRSPRPDSPIASTGSPTGRPRRLR